MSDDELQAALIRLRVARIGIAERRRAELDRWREEHPSASMDAAIRASARKVREGQADEGQPVTFPTREEIRQAEETWLRYHVERDVLLARGRRASGAQVAAALQLEDRTIRRWREDWRRVGLPDR